MRLKRRCEFIFMLVCTNLLGVLVFAIFLDPDAMLVKKVFHGVIGSAVLFFGNRLAFHWWGPNSEDAQRERTRVQEAEEGRGLDICDPTRVMTALLTAGLLAPGASVVAASVPTPEATSMNVTLDDGSTRIRGFVVGLDGVEGRIGVVVVCDGTTGRQEAHLSFGSFPADRPLQAAVLAADGTVERFGPVVQTAHGAGSGFHSPVIEGRDDVLRLMAAAFAEGALVSNGWRSVWNRIPAAENDRAREDILECAGT